ncbi:unnamed protein product [Lepidochelys olivacea]
MVQLDPWTLGWELHASPQSDLTMRPQKEGYRAGFQDHEYRMQPALCLDICKPIPGVCFSSGSRGPLVCDGKAQGIVSQGKPDGSAPQVFTRVSKYVLWIKKTAQADAIDGSIHLFSHDWTDS